MEPGILLNSNEAHSSKNEKYKIKSIIKYNRVLPELIYFKRLEYILYEYIFFLNKGTSQ